jgi:hypothetical protein
MGGTHTNSFSSLCYPSGWTLPARRLDSGQRAPREIPVGWMCVLPKLLAFLPCEKVIIDQDNNPSLISVLQEISLNARVAEGLPGGAFGPLIWHTFTLWGRDNAEALDTQFEESSDLLLPDGQIAVPSRSIFQFEGPSHQSIHKIMGFPLFRSPGEGELRLFLRQIREGEESEERRQVASFPLRLKHHSSDK